jgi:hypothetical protein
VERFLPVKRILALAASLAAAIALLHKIGYRGKYRPGGSPSPWTDGALYFGATFICLFFAFVVVWHVAAWAKKDSRKEEPPETTRGK